MTLEHRPIKADAFVLEQPEDFSASALREFTALLDPDGNYICKQVEADNSVALCFIDVKVFEGKTGVDEYNHMVRFENALVELLDDMNLEAYGPMQTVAELQTYLFRPNAFKTEETVAAEDANLGQEWVMTDDDCAQYARLVEPGVYELIQVVELPDDFQIAHGRVCLNDYSEEEKHTILATYDYPSFETMVETMGEETASQLFTECAFEYEFQKYLAWDEPDFATFEAAAARVKQIISKGKQKEG